MKKFLDCCGKVVDCILNKLFFWVHYYRHSKWVIVVLFCILPLVKYCTICKGLIDSDSPFVVQVLSKVVSNWEFSLSVEILILLLALYEWAISPFLHQRLKIRKHELYSSLPNNFYLGQDVSKKGSQIDGLRKELIKIRKELTSHLFAEDKEVPG